ncbi:MAG: hypothetical protein ACP5GD_01775 [Candidatus Micrarchaeia archaeon]|jgi:hypothetical protein
MLCERCNREIYKYEVCNFCGRKIGTECVKSSRRVNKSIRLVICKDCWSDINKRKLFKSAKESDAALITVSLV